MVTIDPPSRIDTKDPWRLWLNATVPIVVGVTSHEELASHTPESVEKTPGDQMEVAARIQDLSDLVALIQFDMVQWGWKYIDGKTFGK